MHFPLVFEENGLLHRTIYDFKVLTLLKCNDVAVYVIYY